jgi:group I intron endonuclease
MHYYLYEVKNRVNGKIYVGVHKTDNLEDGYMGSGKIILKAIEKHGLENFEKIILEFFDDADSMFRRESEVVDDVFLTRDDVYNLRRGGMGGFDWINSSNIPKFKGHSHSEETKRILSESLKGKERPNLSEACRRAWSSKTDEEKQAFGEIMSNALKGKKQSHEQRSNISKGVKQAAKRRLETPEGLVQRELQRQRMREARAHRKPMTLEEKESHSQRMKEWHRKRREAKQITSELDNYLLTE